MITESEARDMFSRLGEGPEPPWTPPVDSTISAGRAAARRRRALAVSGSALGVAVIAVGAFAAAPRLAGGSSPSPAPPAASGAASPKPAAAPTAAVAGPVWPPPGWSDYPRPPGDTHDDARANRALTFVVDRLDPTRAHVEFSGFSSGEGHHIYRGEWRQGGREGAFSVAFYEPRTPVGMDNGIYGQKSEVPPNVCGVRPVRDGTFRWTSCTKATLPDGTEVRRGTGKDDHARAITVSHIRRDGSAVSISVSTGSYERHPSGESVEPGLSRLPWTQAQLQRVVTDSRFVY